MLAYSSGDGSRLSSPSALSYDVDKKVFGDTARVPVAGTGRYRGFPSALSAAGLLFSVFQCACASPSPPLFCSVFGVIASCFPGCTIGRHRFFLAIGTGSGRIVV